MSLPFSKLVLASSNAGKIAELSDLLAPLGVSVQPQTDFAVPDADETGETFAENACLKASEIAKVTGNWAIADDSGLAVNALNGSPGVYSARYGSSDTERITRLLTELGDEKNRQAKFVCAIAVANHQGEIIIQSEGICHGEILFAPSGDGGFGYDPVFYVPEKQLTFAQMTTDLKKSISHRGNALKALVPQLKKILGAKHSDD